MTIDIEERDGPDSLSPGDWRRLLAMLERAEQAQRNAEAVHEVLGPDIVAVILSARAASGATLSVIQ